MAGELAQRTVSARKSPYYSNHIGNATFTIGDETTDAINVAIQLQTPKLKDLAARGRVLAWLSSDANGDVIAPSPPNGGIAIGTDGTLHPGSPIGLNSLLQIGTLLIDATAEKFKTTTTAVYTVNGQLKTKAAATAILFTAAHVVSASKFGVILIQVNAAGTVSTKVPSATQAYNSAPLALTALPSADSDKVALGYIAIAAKAATWTANTDDLTNGSDLTTATFVDATPSSTVPLTFSLLSEADGDIDITITETTAKTFYLNLLLPDGSIRTSGAITFV